LVERFLKNGPFIKHRQAAFQYACRESRSTETALHHLVSKVEVQPDAKGYVIGRFLGSERTFDSTSTEPIKQAMIRHEVPEAVVDCVEDMLADMNLAVRHGDTTIEGKPDKGCRQGGVLLPLLWCLVLNDRLEDLQKEGFLVYGYADDSHISQGEFTYYSQRSYD
jgi:hypothetical protein